MRPELLAAYRAARYFVDDGERRIDLTLDVRAHELDPTLIRHGVYEWALLTAYNPGSVRRHDDENERAQRAFEARLAAYVLLPAGGGDGLDWFERSVVVLGMSEAAARREARLESQNAFLVGGIGAVTRLCIV